MAKVYRTLTSDEIEEAQICIDNTPPGIHKVKKIIGEEWPTVNSGTNYGSKFRTAVAFHHLKNITYHSRDGENHHKYVVNPET